MNISLLLLVWDENESHDGIRFLNITRNYNNKNLLYINMICFTQSTNFKLIAGKMFFWLVSTFNYNSTVFCILVLCNTNIDCCISLFLTSCNYSVHMGMRINFQQTIQIKRGIEYGQQPTMQMVTYVSTILSKYKINLTVEYISAS